MTDDKEFLKSHLRDFAETHLEKSKSGLYCCPCGSGTGHNRTGALSITKDGRSWKCFSCGAGGDLLDLIGAIYNTQSQAEQFKIARELYGGAYQTAATSEYKAPKKHNAQEAPKVYKDYVPYLEECRAALKTAPNALEYLKRRGISEETAARSGIGYDAECYNKPLQRKIESLIFSYPGANYYTSRPLAEKAYDKPLRDDAGPQPLYNLPDLYNDAGAPVFVLEGEIDALSVKEAGGFAIALCGAQNVRKLLDEIERARPKSIIVLSLDNDEAGRSASEKLAKGLTEKEAPFIAANISGACKDANEALTKDRAAFVRAVARAVRDATEAARNPELWEYKKTSARSHLTEFMDGIASSANTPSIPTGFQKLDNLLDGGLYEGLYIIGAISSLGKTTFALQAADQIAAAGTDVVIFSLEMARSELMAKSISRESCLYSLKARGNTVLAKTTRGITAGSRYQDYTPAEVEAIKQACASYGEYAGNIYILQGEGNIGARQIRNAVEKHIRITGRSPVVIIDYLQLLIPDDLRADIRQSLDKNILELKRISRDHKITVLAISSLNRVSYSSPVSMEAFKETGAIEYSSDVLFGLQLRGVGDQGFNIDEAKAKDPREIELKILKNRNGRTGDTLPFEYYPLFNLFKESNRTTATPAKRERR